MILEPYGDLMKIGNGLWCREGEWRKTPTKRRMTVMKLSDGSLAIHNAFQLKDEDYKKIEELGVVSSIIVPNVFHNSEAFVFKNRFPNAKVYAPKDMLEKVEGCVGVLPIELFASQNPEVACIAIQGLRLLKEIVFVHKPSQTLVLTDLAFNLQKPLTGITKAFFKLNDAYQKFGPSRVFRYLFLKDKKAFKVSVQDIRAQKFDNIIVNHGDVIVGNGHTLFAQAFQKYS